MELIYEKAKKYYPHRWNDSMLRNLVDKGRLTKDEYEAVTGKEYEPQI